MSDDSVDLSAELASYKGERSWRSPAVFAKKLYDFFRSPYNALCTTAIVGVLAFAGIRFFSTINIDTVGELRRYYLFSKRMDISDVHIERVDVDPVLLATYRSNLRRPSLLASLDQRPLSLFLVDGRENVHRLCGWRYAAGCQIGGTNAMLLSSSETGLPQIHEVTHNLYGRVNSNVFTRNSITVDCSGTKETFHTRLEEGATEFTTQYLVNRRMVNPRYPLETGVIARIAEIAGPEAVIDAYFSRNWCPISRAFDREFATKTLPNASQPVGANSFYRLVLLMGVADSGNIRAGEYHDPSSTYIRTYIDDLMALRPTQRPLEPLPQVRQPPPPVTLTPPQLPVQVPRHQVRPPIKRIQSRPQPVPTIERIGPVLRTIGR